MLALLIVLAVVVQGSNEGVLLWLPGTQPGQTTEAERVDRCKLCHPRQVSEWSGSMMAHATRDPIFNALLAITTKHTIPRGFDTPEYCLRCHSPSAWLAGRSHELSVQALFGTDLDGVHCDFCHRLMDPRNPDEEAIVGGTVPGYGNGMYVVQRTNQPMRGSRGGMPEHCEVSKADSFYRTSEYCGVCHEVSNPYFSHDPRGSVPYAQIPMERTYSEWKLSWFATTKERQTCQSCHMKSLPGFASTSPSAQRREDVASHDFSGGNMFGTALVAGNWSGLDQLALQQGIARSEALLTSAVRLEVVAGRTMQETVALVRLTNLTGHKLPTGFPEGRRIWISIVGRDDNGVRTFSSGEYELAAGHIRQDPQLKVYEARPGTSPALANSLGVQAGHSFLSAFNDTFYFDNRIPPRGFRENAFRERRAQPVGYRYEDGQYWDETRYAMPSSTRSVEVAVYYQLLSDEFARFLRDENVGNPYDWNQWGEKVYAAWRTRGGPIVMARQSAVVSSRLPQLSVFNDFDAPLEFSLAQNYPNPFNTETTIEFSVTNNTHAKLELYNIHGQVIETLVSGSVSAGLIAQRVDGMRLSSGVYFYRLIVGASSQTRRMLLLK
jgi:hypothetical protein